MRVLPENNRLYAKLTMAIHYKLNNLDKYFPCYITCTLQDNCYEAPCVSFIPLKGEHKFLCIMNSTMLEYDIPTSL